MWCEFVLGKKTVTFIVHFQAGGEFGITKSSTLGLAGRYWR